MAEKLQFELVSPERLVLSEAVEMVVVPGAEGDFGALPHHAPFISVVRPGIIDVHNGGKVSTRIFVAGGFAEVTEDRVTVLAEDAALLSDVTAEAAQNRLAAAQSSLQAAVSPQEKAAAERAVQAAEVLKSAVA